jgi:hypothetical protein
MFVHMPARRITPNVLSVGADDFHSFAGECFKISFGRYATFEIIFSEAASTPTIGVSSFNHRRNHGPITAMAPHLSYFTDHAHRGLDGASACIEGDGFAY